MIYVIIESETDMTIHKRADMIIHYCTFEENSVYRCLFTCYPDTPKSKNRKQK